MRAYRVDKIRRIEERAIAVEGVDALMQRAAAAWPPVRPTCCSRGVAADMGAT